MNKSIKTKEICITAMGIALFVALSMCLRVPIFENYYVCLGYVVMTVYLYNISIVSGTIVGCIGTFLYCFLIGGLRGMPGWVLGNLVIGVMLGFWFLLTKKITKMPKWLKHVITIIIVILANALGILIIKSLTEVFLYAQPMLIRITTNFTAFVSDSITILLSIPLAIVLKRPLRNLNME